MISNSNQYPVTAKQEDKKDKQMESQSWLITWACLSFLPMAFLIGKTVISWWN